MLESDWYRARKGGALGEAQENAATKAAAHANTPATSDLDPLGRTFQATADNGSFGNYTTAFTLDIDDNRLLVTDARGRTAFTNVYDMSGAEIESSSIDAGERWLLLDAAGQPLQAWDSRGFVATFDYDALRRPTKLYVALEADPGARRLAEELVYGETLGFAPSEAPAKNLCGVAYRRYDQAGVAVTDERDFQGNVTSATRELLAGDAYDTEIDWSEAHATPEQHTTTAAYDALNRPISATTPDGSVTTTTFNQRSLVAAIEVGIRGAAATPFVTAVSYDAKGQRKSIAYGNGAGTTYAYDPDTFRLTQLVSTRPGGPNPLQDLSYAYDPVGNVTNLADAAQQTIFFDNQVVDRERRLHLRPDLPAHRRDRTRAHRPDDQRTDRLRATRRGWASRCRWPTTPRRCATTPRNTNTTASGISPSSNTRPTAARGRARTTTRRRATGSHQAPPEG